MMTPAETQAKLIWEDGVPVSPRFADPYHARSDGLAESRHVFLEGNDLPRRWRGARGFRLAELGFGTGLNVLAALWLWHRSAAAGATLEIASFERWPLPREEMARALSRWPELAALARPLLAAWTGGGTIDLPGARLTLVTGDARATLPRWHGSAEAWFLDGFAPSRNPEMWEPSLLAEVAAHTRPDGTVATYSAAGHVRRSLQAAGFAVRRLPGFGAKREMLAGRLAHGSETGAEPDASVRTKEDAATARHPAATASARGAEGPAVPAPQRGRRGPEGAHHHRDTVAHRAGPDVSPPAGPAQDAVPEAPGHPGHAL